MFNSESLIPSLPENEVHHDLIPQIDRLRTGMRLVGVICGIRLGHALLIIIHCGAPA